MSNDYKHFEKPHHVSINDEGVIQLSWFHGSKDDNSDRRMSIYIDSEPYDLNATLEMYAIITGPGHFQSTNYLKTPQDVIDVMRNYLGKGPE